MQTRSPFIHKIFVSRGDGTLSINSLNILLFKFVEGKQTILICVCACVLCLALLTMTSLTLAAASWASAWPPGSWGRASSCAGIHRSDLNAIRLIVDVEDTLLDLVVDLPGGVDEGLLHISGSLSGCLHEDQAMFPSKSFSLFSLDISPGFQVTETNTPWRLTRTEKPATDLLLPMSMMTMLLLLCCLASSSQVVRWLKVSLLVMSYTRRAPAAPL